MTPTSTDPGNDYGLGRIRHFSFHVEVCDSWCLWVRGCPEVGLSGIVEMLTKVPGVEHIYACGYKLNITLGEAFTWHEVGPEVERIIAVFGEAKSA